MHHPLTDFHRSYTGRGKIEGIYTEEIAKLQEVGLI
jgi:hypothetical protein